MGTYNEPQEILKASANKREKVAGILSSIQPIKQK